MNLREEINNMKIIDGHLHAVDPWYWMGAVGSYAFEELVAKLPVPNKYSTITRTRALMRCYKEIWGFPYDELTPENVAELDRLYSESRKDEAAYVMKAFDRAGIERDSRCA